MAVAQSNGDAPKTFAGEALADSDRSWSIDAVSSQLIDRPLDYFTAEHNRQRGVANILSRIADEAFDIQGAPDVIDFLEGDYELNLGDKEDALYPLMREFCSPADGIDRILDRLRGEQVGIRTICKDVARILRSKLDSGAAFSAAERRRIASLANMIRENIAFENGVLLPIARVRLKDADLAALGEKLKSRRAKIAKTDKP
ncbi:MAG: hypothetical protein Tsb0010_04740 [Parvularculaceae bacterium]